MIDVAGRFGDNLVCCRKRANISQEELGYLASVHRTEISQLERGLRIPRIDTLVKIRDGLELTADDLLVGISWTPGNYRPGGFVERDEG